MLQHLLLYFRTNKMQSKLCMTFALQIANCRAHSTTSSPVSFTDLYICVCVCMCVCECLYIHICVCVCVHIFMCVCV